MSSTKYFDGDCLTDDAILSNELLSKCAVTTTPPRALPNTLNMKDSDVYDRYTKNVKILYPESGSSTTVIIPNVVFHCETFEYYGKTCVYTGIPQSFTQILNTKLAGSRHKASFEDPGFSSDEKYWWTRTSFTPAAMDKEYIFVVEEDGDDIVETPFASFQDLFVAVGSSVVANVTCSIKMSTKIEVERKGAMAATDEWKMGITVARVNVIDLVTIDKPRTSLTQKSIAGKKDKASSRLLARMREREGSLPV